VRLPEVGNEIIDLRCPVRPSGEPAHLCQPSSGEPILLGTGFDELVLDEALVDESEPSPKASTPRPAAYSDPQAEHTPSRWCCHHR
jgi:hypothetical protein